MEPPTPENERLHNLDRLVRLIDDRSSVDYEFKRAVGSLSDDLLYVANALRRDAADWRLNRAFHTVHVPSLLAIVAMLDGIDGMKSVSSDEQHQINSAIYRAAQLASSARERIEQSALTEAKVELSVLADYAPNPVQEFQKASLFERTRDGVLSTTGSTFLKAKSGIEAVPDLVGAVKDGVSTSFERATALSTLASNLQRTLSGLVSDNVTGPIAMRQKAASKAVTHGAGAGVGLGVLAGVLFPPLLPVSAGAAVLVAMRSWRSEMRRARELSGIERAERIAELKAERTAALLQLTSGASSVQMETEEISLTLDAETGEADALVLKGEHAGRTWSDLSVPERVEVASLFVQGADVLLSILEFGRENL